MKKIFATFNRTRKPEFQFETYAFLDKGKIVFRKECIDSRSIEHLDSMKKSFLILSKYNDEQLHFASILNPSGSDKFLEFEHVEGISLEKQLLEAVLAGDQEEQLKVLDNLETILGKLSKNPHKHHHEYSKEIFGPNFYSSFPGSACIYPGLLDCNFDNIIVQNGKSSIIDYEWRFDHCLPYDYVLGRTIMWFCIRHNELLRLNSERIQLVAALENVFVPTVIYEKYSALIKKFSIIQNIEWGYFQKWVTGIELSQNIQRLPKSKKIQKPIYALEKIKQQSEEIGRLQTDKTQLTQDLEAGKRHNEELKIELDKITHSRAYKVALKARSIKRRVLPS